MLEVLAVLCFRAVFGLCSGITVHELHTVRVGRIVQFSNSLLEVSCSIRIEKGNYGKIDSKGRI